MGSDNYRHRVSTLDGQSAAALYGINLRDYTPILLSGYGHDRTTGYADKFNGQLEKATDLSVDDLVGAAQKAGCEYVVGVHSTVTIVPSGNLIAILTQGTGLVPKDYKPKE